MTIDASPMTITNHGDYTWGNVDIVLSTATDPPKLYWFGVSPIEAGLTFTVTLDAFISPSGKRYDATDGEIADTEITADTPNGRARFTQRF